VNNAIRGNRLLRHEPEKRATWGDQGDRTFRNPIIWADYNNPFLLQHGDDFYMVAASHHFMGIPVLHSKDLVNWQLLTRIYSRLDWDDKYNHPGQAYQQGSWAPVLVYHDGRFFMYCINSTDGVFMTSAASPVGPWEPVTLIQRVFHWEDPYPFWDDDGKAYFFHSGFAKSPIVLHRMSLDGKRLLDEGTVLQETLPNAHNPFVIKRNGYYYLFATGSRRSMSGVGGVEDVYRSTTIYGPYEHRVILDAGGVGPSPGGGGFVELPSGEWWFLHHVGIARHGRLPFLEPAGWEEDWPRIGIGSIEGGPGWLVWAHAKPNTGQRQPITIPASSDEFSSPELGPQWRWNHNPDPTCWSLTERPGYLRLRASLPETAGGSDGEHHPVPFAADSIIFARNTLVQLMMGKHCIGSTVMDVSNMANGQRAGLCLFNKDYAWIGVVQENGRRAVKAYRNNAVVEGPQLTQDTIWLQAICDDGSGSLAYSLDGQTFVPLGQPLDFQIQWFEAQKFALFTYNIDDKRGTVDFDWFHLEHD